MPEKLDRCVEKVKGQKGVDSAYAICTDSLKEDIYELAKNPEHLDDANDPRGDGAVRDDRGQSNIIDYSNREPLLFGLGENSTHDYPGKIVISNTSASILYSLIIRPVSISH